MAMLAELPSLRPAMEVAQLPKLLEAEHSTTGLTCTTALRPALQGIVEDPTFSNTNYLTYNRVYSKVGSTLLVSADPSVVHFGGFQLGQIHRQLLRIKNISGNGTRIHIIPPTTPFFKVDMQQHALDQKCASWVYAWWAAALKC